MNRLTEIQNLLFAEDKCPYCHLRSVSVRYTEPQEGVYRLWFLCSKCKFQQRVQLAGKPKHFSIERVDEPLQAYDADILDQCHFKLPEDPTSSSK